MASRKVEQLEEEKDFDPCGLEEAHMSLDLTACRGQIYIHKVTRKALSA